MANYRALSRKTKHELQEIAEELEVSQKEFKIKKDYYNAIQAYFDENKDNFPENHKFYELSHPGRTSQLSSPTKRTQALESEDEDDETEQEPEEDAIFAEVVVTENDDENEPSSISVWLNKLRPSTLNVIEVENFIEEKNMQLREILSDPYNINDFIAVLEFLILNFSLCKSTKLFTYFPSSVKEYLPKQVLGISVFDYQSLDANYFATILLWAFTSYIIPHFASFYINFTYDFEYDAFTFGLVKLLVGLLLFRTEIPGGEAVNEIAYQLSFKSFSISYALVALRHYSLYAIVYLRGYFGDWILIGALFSSIIALYANLTFI